MNRGRETAVLYFRRQVCYNLRMAIIFTLIFWLIVFLLVLLYFLFPVYVRLLGLFSRKRAVKPCAAPSASLMILYGGNLEQLKAKIENCLLLEPKGEGPELVVAVNQRDAEVDSLVTGYFNKGVKLFYPAEKQSPAGTMVRCATECKGEVVVVTDSVSKLDKYAVKNILRKFTDEKTGAVSGKAVYTGEHENYMGGLKITEAYNEYVIRLLDAVGLVVSANILLYAFRKDAVESIPAGSSGSSVIPLRVIYGGYRSRYEPLAVTELELQGKAEVLAGEEALELAASLGSVSSVKDLLKKWKINAWVCALFENLLMPSAGVFALSLFVVNLLLINTSAAFVLSLGAQVIFYAAAATGVSKTAYYISLHIYASVRAVYISWRKQNAV